MVLHINNVLIVNRIIMHFIMFQCLFNIRDNKVVTVTEAETETVTGLY